MYSLYPLKMMPLFKNKIWGGCRIKKVFGIDYEPLPNCGEMWLVSGIKGNESVITNGFLEGNDLNEVLEIYMSDLVGEKVYQKFGNKFPLLIKIIDANDKLSVQVHPDEKTAEKQGSGSGKTEMWYIIDAEKDAKIIDGFKKDSSPEEFKKALSEKTVVDFLNIESAEKGDVFFIPEKRIHAIGSGILLAEIQQASDTTYRVYDWERVDSDGKPRTLHIKEALDSINFSKAKNAKTLYQYQLNKTTELTNCDCFTVNLLHLDHTIEKNFSSLDSFIIYVCLEGRGLIKALDTIIKIHPGESVLLPVGTNTVELHPESRIKLLEVYI